MQMFKNKELIFDISKPMLGTILGISLIGVQTSLSILAIVLTCTYTTIRIIKELKK
jgi:hypothetical protein